VVSAPPDSLHGEADTYTPSDHADKALEVYVKLRDAKKLTVELVRRGAPITITYTIKN